MQRWGREKQEKAKKAFGLICSCSTDPQGFAHMGPLEEPGQLTAQPRGAGHTGEEKGDFGDMKEMQSGHNPSPAFPGHGSRRTCPLPILKQGQGRQQLHAWTQQKPAACFVPGPTVPEATRSRGAHTCSQPRWL